MVPTFKSQERLHGCLNCGRPIYVESDRVPFRHVYTLGPAMFCGTQGDVGRFVLFDDGVVGAPLGDGVGSGIVTLGAGQAKEGEVDGLTWQTLDNQGTSGRPVACLRDR